MIIWRSSANCCKLSTTQPKPWARFPVILTEDLNLTGITVIKKEYVPPREYSWWWVQKEEYVITLGPLLGYRVVKNLSLCQILGS